MKKYFPLLISLFILGCTSDQSEKVSGGEALGTTFQIIYYSEEDIPLEKALDSIFEAINSSMSTYRKDSDISRINRGDSLVQVDTMFRKVFEYSQQVNEESGGFFDPTVGDLVNMYGFGPEKSLKIIDSSTVDSLMTFVGLEKISISDERKVIKKFPEVYLDFNAIAKGYAIDVIGKYLEGQEVENYLVELGGELLAKGENVKKNGPWRVGIDDPEQEEGTRILKAVLELKNRAMATSGNYRKHRTDPITGTKYVHTINPKTGYPEKSNLLSASVLADNCTLADAYATAFMAMGLERSKKLLNELESVDAYLLFSTPDGTIDEYKTEGFGKVLVQE